MSPLVGFSSDGQLVLDQRLVVLAGRRRTGGRARSDPRRRAAWRARAPCGRRRRPGLSAQRLRVFDDGAVVVLPALGVAAAAIGRRRRRSRAASRHSSARAQPHRPSTAGRVSGTGESVTTSTPRGIVNANSLSAIPTFSFRFVKEKLERAALGVGGDQAADARACAGRPRGSANRSPAAAILGTSFSARVPAGSARRQARRATA